jgi:hypothetical protein
MYVVAGGMIVGLYSCKKDIPKRELLYNYEVNDFSELFKVFWQGMNSNYLFLDKETVNWDNVYREYKPKFDSLNLRRYSDTTMNICFQYMVDMTKDLKDGQYALQLLNAKIQALQTLMVLSATVTTMLLKQPLVLTTTGGDIT